MPMPAPSTAPAAARPGAVQPMSPADYRGGPVSTPAGPSLYNRLGGVSAIGAVVDNFVDRVGTDDRINALFRGVDLVNLKRLLTEQICVATGGPCTYSGRTMRAAHTGMNITDAQFNALLDDLSASLDQFNVPVREKAELFSALGGMRGEIVGR